MNDDEIQELSKERWKNLVNRKVEEKAFSDLCQIAQLQSKTKNLIFNDLAGQHYITSLPTVVARHIFRVRSQTVSCKVNQKSSYTSVKCRTGCDVDETQEHVINCTNILGGVFDYVSLTAVYRNLDDEENKIQAALISTRMTIVQNFMKNLMS